jgi:hypothetical protein
VARHVKGTLFSDYVRMIRAQKNIDWKRHLHDEDVGYLVARVDPNAWYPMGTFERMGNAILAEIGGGDVEGARMWGRASVDRLRNEMPTLVAANDPLETLMRFQVLRSTFFDFEALEIRTAALDHAQIVVHYHMGRIAEEAAAYQAMGFFERLLVVAGAEAIEARFVKESWTGDGQTLLELHWEPPL